MFYRLYRSRSREHRELYASAPLHYAPHVAMRLMPTDEGHSCIAFTGIYERDLTRRIVAAARRGGTLVDVGANYGYYSLLWAAQRRGNRVLAFEASPRNFASFEANVADNGFGEQVAAHRIALGRSSGRLAFDLGPAEQSGWGGLAAQPGADTVNVDVARLDDVWPGGDIAALKIDVEGADTWVLQGAERLFRERAVAVVYYEQNKVRLKELGIGADEAQAWLKAKGYVVRALSDPAKELVEFEARPRTPKPEPHG